MNMRWSLFWILIFIVTACSSAVEPATPSPSPTEDSIAPAGEWSLDYLGVCEARESEKFDVTISEEGYVLFDDYTLIPDETGLFVGSAQFSTPMPADGRDIVFTIEFKLQQESRTQFAGTESVTEVGRGSDDCPVQLVYVDDS